MIGMLPWLRSPNLWLAAGILAMVLLIFNAGERHNQMQHDSETAEVNARIVEDRGRDEAEIAAERDAASRTDAVVAGAVTQQCIITDGTANLLASIK